VKTSKPNLLDFNPFAIPYQGKVICYLRRDFDFAIGTPEILLSGSYGSAKSILMAHIAVTHCLMNNAARVCLARRSMPDLRRTIFNEVLEHIKEDLVDGEDYEVNNTTATIKFLKTGSEIISISWADKRYEKGKSLKLSGLVFEELSENDDKDRAAFMALKARLRRIPTVKENFLIAATNPGAPSHWVHKYWMESDSPTRKVFYSVTTDNPFLDPIYIEQLKKDLDPKNARRYIYGEWIEVDEEVIYSCYKRDRNFKKEVYKINLRWPISIAFDFNIGEGKPMSCVLSQYDPHNDVFHFFEEAVVMGARTEDIMEELASRGLFNFNALYQIHGDASGGSNSTRSILSDYGIIKKFLENYRPPNSPVGKVRFEFKVPKANPPIRERHNMVNAYCFNEAGQIRLQVYEKCKTLDEGLRLTALKKGGNYIEDDSKHFQHITTAAGYRVVQQVRENRTSEVYTTPR
jgi:phage terminase large subunit